MSEFTANNTEIAFDAEGRLVSGEFGDFYFSPQGGLEESKHVFLKGNNLHERFGAGGDFFIAEAGFGTGLNFLATLQLWQESCGSCSAGMDSFSGQLVYHAFELHPLEKDIMRQAHDNWPELTGFSGELLDAYMSASKSSDLTINLENYRVKLLLHFGDIAVRIGELTDKIDAWYLDGFAPDRNPQMWSGDVFSHIRRLTKSTTTAATYSCARVVRENFAEIGFKAEKTPGFGNKRYMLSASCGTS